MKEQFISIPTLASQIAPLNDMDLQYYLTSVSSTKTDFATSDVQAALNSVASRKQGAFTDAYYINQSGHLGNTAQGIDDLIVKQLETTEQNASIVGRQNEINEWANSNKLDTLFFMQILFICITFITLMMFLKNNGFITPFLFIIFSIVASLIAIASLILRARYTSVVRDSRYWHKARFPSVANPYLTAPVSVCPTY